MDKNDIRDSAPEASTQGTQDPIAGSAPRKLAPIGMIFSLLPIIVGVLAAIAAFDCKVDDKYLGSLGGLLLTISALIAVIFPFIFPIAFKRERDLRAIEKVKWLDLLPAIASFYISGYTLLNDIGEWGDAILLLSLLSGVFFVLKILDGMEGIKICGIGCLILLGTAIIALLYLDFDIELNSPFKLAVQFGAIGLMLGTVADARFILSRIGTGWYTFFKSVAASTALICAGLICVAFARGFTVFPEIYLASAVLYLCYAISAIAQTLCLAKCSSKCEK